MPLDDDTATVLGAADGADERALSRALLAAAAQSLDGRERRVLLLRYFLDLNQDEVGRAVGISQVHVSRVLRRAIVKMRAGLDPDEPSDPEQARTFEVAKTALSSVHGDGCPARPR